MGYGETRGPTRGDPVYTRAGRPDAELSFGRQSYNFSCSGQLAVYAVTMWSAARTCFCRHAVAVL